MTTTVAQFFNLIEETIHFRHDSGKSSLVGYPKTSGWRTLPFLVVAQIDYVATLELEGGNTVRIRPGQTVSLEPGRVHKFTKITRRAAYSHWAHIECDVFPGVSLFHFVEPPLIIRGKRSLKIGQINHELGEISKRERSLASLLKRQALGWELISLLLRSVSLDEDRIGLIRQAFRLAPILAYIEENLANPISHELLAQKAALSPSRFHVLFRAALGSAPYEYVQKVRLKRAQQLLIRTDQSIAEVGLQTGHPDPYHFSRMFRRSFGLSPAKYRKQVAIHTF
jgi:AraC-like DNA-binding protein